MSIFGKPKKLLKKKLRESINAKVIDTLEYEMADSQGRWLGTGYTDIKENKLFYKQNVVFKEVGDYKFSIQQATRSIHDIEGKNPLEGITNVGLSIELVK